MDAPPVVRGGHGGNTPKDDMEGEDFDDGATIPLPSGLNDRFPSEKRDIYNFIITYSPPKNLTKHMPFFLEAHGDATAISVDQVGSELDAVSVSIRPHDGSKTTAYQAVERVMVDDLGLQIENIEG